jgi:hypothetical protein
LSAGRDVGSTGHGSGSLVTKVHKGYSVTWVVIRDNEDLVRGIASIGPSDANLLALVKGERRVDCQVIIGLSENGRNESNKEREGKECSEHGCSADRVAEAMEG